MTSITKVFQPREHEEKIQAHFGDLAIRPDAPPVAEAVTIMIFVNRSGSTFIGENLRATGSFSGFGEPLSHGIVLERARTHGLATFEDYLRWLLDNLRRPGTQFGMKASLDQVLMLLRAGAFPRLFPKVNWLTVHRRDVLSQAISFSIAQQTQQWQSFEEGNGSEPVYDFKDILWHMDQIAASYQHITSFCAASALDVFPLEYEAFLDDPLAHTRAAAAHCGVIVDSIDQSRLRLRKQASGLNARFREQFRRDYLGRLNIGPGAWGQSGRPA